MQVRDGMLDALEKMDGDGLERTAYTARSTARDALRDGDADAAAFWSGILSLALKERTRRFTAAAERRQA